MNDEPNNPTGSDDTLHAGQQVEADQHGAGRDDAGHRDHDGTNADRMKTAELFLPFLFPAEDMRRCLDGSPTDPAALAALAKEMDWAGEILWAVNDAIAGHETRVWTEDDAILVCGPAGVIDDLIGKGHLEKWPRTDDTQDAPHDVTEQGALKESGRSNTTANKLTDAPTSRHKTIRVRGNGFDAEIDEEIAPLIRELWKARFLTMMSCQDNPEGWVWIQFPYVVFAEAFMALIEKESGIPLLWQQWKFDIYPVTRHQMLFHDFPKELIPKGPSLRFAVSIRFPMTDLPTIMETVVRHNEKNENTLDSE